MDVCTVVVTSRVEILAGQLRVIDGGGGGTWILVTSHSLQVSYIRAGSVAIEDIQTAS